MTIKQAPIAAARLKLRVKAKQLRAESELLSHPSAARAFRDCARILDGVADDLKTKPLTSGNERKTDEH